MADDGPRIRTTLVGAGPADPLPAGADADRHGEGCASRLVS